MDCRLRWGESCLEDVRALDRKLCLQRDSSLAEGDQVGLNLKVTRGL